MPALFWEEQRGEDVTIHCRDEGVAGILLQLWIARFRKEFRQELREWHGIGEDEAEPGGNRQVNEQPEQLELFPEFVNPLREDRPVGRIILEALDDPEHPAHEAAKEHVKRWGRPGVKWKALTLTPDYVGEV